jgi:hypothetical protein
MGYWSTHPMGGDGPLDDQDKLIDYITIKCFKPNIKRKFDTMHYQHKDYEKLNKKYITYITENLPELITYCEELENSFVLPYLIAEYKIQIKDKELSNAVKSLIYDGGGAERGYDEDDTDSPQAHAQHLRNCWDGLMAGTKAFTEDLFDGGLFAAIFRNIEDNDKPNLINKN